MHPAILRPTGVHLLSLTLHVHQGRMCASLLVPQLASTNRDYISYSHDESLRISWLDSENFDYCLSATLHNVAF